MEDTLNMPQINNYIKYSTYEDSEVDWLGEIPEHWDKLPLFTIATLKSIVNHQDRELLSVYLDRGVIRFSEVNEKRTNVTSEDLSNYQAVDPGDLVLNNQQAWRGSVGVSEYQGIVSPAYLVLKLSKKVDTKFANYFFRDRNMVYFYLINSKGVGTIQRNLYWQQLKRVIINLPPIPEQSAIATFLDHKTAQIDQAIAQKERMIELLKERRQIIIQNAVTRGLNPNIKMKDSGVEWIGEIPEHWEVIPVRRLIDVRDGTHDTPVYIEDGEDSFPLVTSKDFEGEIINFENIKRISRKDHIEISNRSGVKKGDVLMSMIGGNIGKSVIINDNDDFSIKNVALFRTRNNISLAKYLRYYFESGLLQIQIELRSRGGAQGFLSLGDIRNLLFFKMPQNELERIVEFIDNTATLKIHTAISLKEKEIEKLKEYKATLINSAVTGKIKVY